MVADPTLLNRALSRALDSREWPLRGWPAQALPSGTKAETGAALTDAVERATKAVEEVYYSSTADDGDAAARAAVQTLMPWIDPSNLRLFVGRAIATLKRG